MGERGLDGGMGETDEATAPEVIRGQGYGFSCDWWSLGVISETSRPLMIAGLIGESV